MMHSDVKMPKSSSGICNILIAVLVFLIFLFAPLAQTVVNGEVLESFTVAENIDKGWLLFVPYFFNDCSCISSWNLEVEVA